MESQYRYEMDTQDDGGMKPWLYRARFTSNTLMNNNIETVVWSCLLSYGKSNTHPDRI